MEIFLDVFGKNKTGSGELRKLRLLVLSYMVPSGAVLILNYGEKVCKRGRRTGHLRTAY
jgi:hypothetical protein